MPVAFVKKEQKSNSSQRDEYIGYRQADKVV